MVSPLSPLSGLRGEPSGTLESVLAGRQSYERSQLNQQAMRQNEQQISRSDYDQATQRLGVINRLAQKAKSLGLDQRQAFVQSINPDMLKSVGIDAQISSVQLDDNSLDALIAQTGAALPEGSQYRKESVSTTSGLKVFNPSTGTYEDAVDSSGQKLTAPQYDTNLQGQLARSKQDAQNQSDRAYKPGTQAAVTTAELNARLSTEPQLRSAIESAEQDARAGVEKKIAQAGQLGKLADAENVYNRLQDSDLQIIYGRGEQWYPDFLRSQRGIDLIADRDQLLGMLQLGARGELKGQGPITEGEQKILSNAVTALGNKNISPEKAKTSLDEAMVILRRNAGKGIKPASSGSGVATPGINPESDQNTTNWNDLP
jgi:hypothetical protein